MDCKVGDLVQLKSGGPQMVIIDIGVFSGSGNERQRAKCEWSDAKTGLRNEGVFELTSLEKLP